MSITNLGNKTKSIFLKGIESHKLHQEFEVASGESVKIGQPVKLNADGEILAAGSAEESTNVIGIAIHNGDAEEQVTVGMKAFTIVWAMPNGAVDAGPVAYDGMNNSDGDYNSVAAVGSTEESTTVGWALDKTGAGDEMTRLALR